MRKTIGNDDDYINEVDDDDAESDSGVDDSSDDIDEATDYLYSAMYNDEDAIFIRNADDFHKELTEIVRNRSNYRKLFANVRLAFAEISRNAYDTRSKFVELPFYKIWQCQFNNN